MISSRSSLPNLSSPFYDPFSLPTAAALAVNNAASEQLTTYIKVKFHFTAEIVCMCSAVSITDIYPVDTVLPVHIVWHDEATAKSTTKYLPIVYVEKSHFTAEIQS